MVWIILLDFEVFFGKKKTMIFVYHLFLLKLEKEQEEPVLTHLFFNLNYSQLQLQLSLFNYLFEGSRFLLFCFFLLFLIFFFVFFLYFIIIFFTKYFFVIINFSIKFFTIILLPIIIKIDFEQFQESLTSQLHLV